MLRNLQNAIEDETTLSSIDDDDRTYVSLASEDQQNKCPTKCLILIFYGGKFSSKTMHRVKS